MARRGAGGTAWLHNRCGTHQALLHAGCQAPQLVCCRRAATLQWCDVHAASLLRQRPLCALHMMRAAAPLLPTAVSEWVKQNVHCPYIITRRDIVVNARMKISSQLPHSGGGSPREVLQ